jgi:catechol 2,3-dioxygenase-like lactoylglutathione lyase family enzyme
MASHATGCDRVGNVLANDVKSSPSHKLSAATHQYLQLRGMGKAKTFHQAAARNSNVVIEMLGDRPLRDYSTVDADLSVGFTTGHVVNPVERGHIAYRTDDLAAFKAHLEAHGIAYSDWGETAVAGWEQIFFYDPDGNVIEVHQVNDRL